MHVAHFACVLLFRPCVPRGMRHAFLIIAFVFSASLIPVSRMEYDSYNHIYFCPMDLFNPRILRGMRPGDLSMRVYTISFNPCIPFWMR